MRTAAFAEVYSPGLGLALLHASDPGEVGALQAMSVEAAELARRRDERLARMTANYFARSFK